MNSRKNKFRAWDKLAKKFTYPDQGYQGHYVLDLNGRFHNLQNGSGGDEYVVQQFTGLHDKNKKPIYEGDRVRFGYTEKEDFFGEVIWLEDRASFGVRYENITETFEDLGFVQKFFEVVGNIFQLPCNPDHNGECLVCDNWLCDCPFNKENKMNAHQENLERIKKLTTELSECMTSPNFIKYPPFYTAEEDPEVDFIVDRRWTYLGKNYKYPIFKKGRYSELPYDCKMIVDDIVNSSQLECFKQWDANFRRKYYTKAILMAYDLGKENNKNIFTMIRGWFYSVTKCKTRC